MSDYKQTKMPVSLPQFSAEIPSNNCASVPLALYCELSEELEATQQQLQAVHVHNQHLAQQNQQLQHEIRRLLESATPSMASQYANLPTNTVLWNDQRQPPLNSAIPASWPASLEPELKPKINGIVLATSIVLIVLTAFTCGFLIVRPLLQQQQR